MTKSHATGTGSDAPTPSQMAELHRQIGTGKVTKERLQEFLRGGTQAPAWTKMPLPRKIDLRYPDLNEAKKIVGQKNFFGPNEWLKFFGKKFRLDKVPPIPWAEDELRNPGLTQSHFLFLGTDVLGGSPLDLIALRKFFPGPKHPKLYSDWFLAKEQIFARKACGTRWYLMPIGVVHGSNRNSYDLQRRMLPTEYEVPTTVERAIANILFHSLNGKYLDADYWARTDDESASGRRVNVQGNSDNGVNVNNWNDNANDNIGVAASRKLL